MHARSKIWPHDYLVPKRVSVSFSLKRKLETVALTSGKSESEIVRDALTAELRKACCNESGTT